MHRILILLTMVGILACDKPRDADPFPHGTYKGTFKRYNQENSPEANVTIRFLYPNWEGSSSHEKYPALGKGTYALKDDALQFNNESVWTADFDWTLILDGMYLDRAEEDSLVFTKSYSNGWVDVYKLKKDP